MSNLRMVLLGSGVWIASAVLTFAILAFAGDAPRGGDRTQRVAVSELLAALEGGRVEAIRVAGRVATFRVREGSRTVERWTIGPFDDRGQVLGLRPSNPDLPAPKIEIEK